MKKESLKKMVHGWSWWDVPLLLLVLGIGIFLGTILILYGTDDTWEAVHMLNAWKMEIIELSLIAFLLGRLIGVAKWPRKPALDYNKITPSGVVAANFVSLIMGFMLIIITLALVAPGVLELLAKHFGDK